MPAALRKSEPTETDTDAVFRAIADPTRRAILDVLRTTPSHVNALAARFDQTRPGISKHLRVLREAGIVTETKTGRERLYRLKPSRLEPVDRWILTYRGFWQTQLDALKLYMETKHDDQ
jgi:DNA-binding transcriptional ArsR family regulator